MPNALDSSVLSIAPQNVSIPTQNADVPALLFAAQNTSSADAQAAIVLIHDLNGLDESTQRAAARLAALGYAVVAPDFFASSGGPGEASAEDALFNFASGLSDTDVIAEVLAAVGFLRTAANGDIRIGIIGWGWGGAYALMAAAYDGQIYAAVDVAGDISYAALTSQRPGSPLNFVANLGGAFLGAFPGNDPRFPKIEIDRLAGRIVEHDKRGEVKVYPEAPPRFWQDDALPQTQALWRRITNFLDEYLRGDELEPGDLANHPSPQGIPDTGYPNEASRLHA